MKQLFLASTLALAVLTVLWGCSSLEEEKDGDDACGGYDLTLDLTFLFPGGNVDGSLSVNLESDDGQARAIGELNVGGRGSDFDGTADEGGIQGKATYSAVEGGLDCGASPVTLWMDVSLAYDAVIGWADVYCGGDVDPDALLDSYDVTGSVGCSDTDFFAG